MRHSTLGLIAAFLAGALAAGGLAMWLSGGRGGEPQRSARTPAPPPSAEPAPPPEEEDDPFSIPPDQLAAVMEKLREIEGEESEAEPERGDEAPPPPPTQVEYSVPEKYEEQTLSEVPHRLLGAWDDAPDAAGAPGRHRSFVLVVEPGLTDRQLESLARDVYRLHRDADRLDVRIYDRESAATDSRVSDGGKYAREHQVAQVTRHRGLNVDVIRVRGRVVGP